MFTSECFRSGKMNILSATFFAAVCYYYFMVKGKAKWIISGKVALITGATSGIGEACARKFHELGCNLIITGRNLNRLKEIQNELHSNNSNVNVDVQQLDVTDNKSVIALTEFVNKEFPKGVDILLNNAGVSFRGTIKSTSLLVHKELMEVNYFGQVNLINQLLPGIIKGYETRKYNRFIASVSSTQGKISIPFRSAYSASKFAVQSFYDCLRAEVHEYGINVGVISPGYVNTNLSINAITADGTTHGKMDSTQASGFSPEQVAIRIVRMIERCESDVHMFNMTSKIAVLLRFCTPSIYFWIMRKRAKSRTGL